MIENAVFKSLSITMCGLFFWVFLVILFIIKTKEGKKVSKYFKYLIIFDFIVIITKFISIIITDKVPNEPLLPGLLAQFHTYFICTIAVIFILVIHNFYNTEKMKEFMTKKYFKPLLIFIFALPLIAMFFMKLDCIYDPIKNIYEYDGKYVYFAYSYIGLFAISLLSLTIQGKFKSKNTNVAAIYLCFLCFIFDVICRIIVGFRIMDTSVLLTLIIFALYLTTESQEAILLNELNTEINSLNELNNKKSDFLYESSNKIRALLNVIMGYAEISNETQDKTIYEEQINNIYDSSNELTYQIEYLIDISNYETKKIKVEEENYHLDNLIYEINSIYNSIITKQKLIFNIDKSLPKGYKGDSKLIYKIILYMINAATKSTNNDLKLTINGKQIDKYLELNILISYNTNIKEIVNFDNYINTHNNSKNDLLIAKNLSQLLNSDIEIQNINNEITYILKVKQEILNETPVGDIFSVDAINNLKTKYDYSNKKALYIGEFNSNIKLFISNLQQKNMYIESLFSGKGIENVIKNKKYDCIFINGDQIDIGLRNTINNLYMSGTMVPPIIILSNYSKDYSEIEKNKYSLSLKLPIDRTQANYLISNILNGGERIDK